ncbi:MAG TPA: enoyl-CoA hydratase/isomerase family protein [Acidimicrobiales bacterium]
MSAEALLAELRSDVPPERSVPVRVSLHGGLGVPQGVSAERLVSLPFVVVGVTEGPVDPGWLELCDVALSVGDPTLDRVEENLAASPVAATALALLLRGAERRSIAEGLVAESASYSVLQSGPEFAAWRAAHPPRPERDEGPRLRTELRNDTLLLTLTRPARLNALDAQMRDELVEALTLAAADPGITSVEWRGEGRAFCTGGDLDEFGSRPDPATAHLVRLQRSVGRLLAQLEKPTVSYVHGATMGSGIELAAFTTTVVAAADTQIALPEIGLGLVPGAGGTVSLPRRIGRLRTAYLAFTGSVIDAATALEWGLVDRLED